MIRSFRAEMEQLVTIFSNYTNAQFLKEIILGEYVSIARLYGNRVKKRYGLD